MVTEHCIVLAVAVACAFDGWLTLAVFFAIAGLLQREQLFLPVRGELLVLAAPGRHQRPCRLAGRLGDRLDGALVLLEPPLRAGVLDACHQRPRPRGVALFDVGVYS